MAQQIGRLFNRVRNTVLEAQVGARREHLFEHLEPVAIEIKD